MSKPTAAECRKVARALHAAYRAWTKEKGGGMPTTRFDDLTDHIRKQYLGTARHLLLAGWRVTKEDYASVVHRASFSE